MQAVADDTENPAAGRWATDRSKTPAGTHENPLSNDPSRIGELCFANLRPIEGHSRSRSGPARNLIEVPKALDEFGELHQALD